MKTPAELIRVVQERKLAGIIGVEGGHMIEDNLLYLDSLFYRGARYLTLTWNNSTSWASSSEDESKSNPQVTKGLSKFGEKIVKHMNELGMIIDVSHVGEQTLADVLTITTKPIIASLSSVYALTPHHRNLKDGQIKAIAQNGGIIQVAFVAAFLDSNHSRLLQSFDAKHRTEIDSLVSLKWSGPAIGIFLKRKYPNELSNVILPLSVLLDHIDYIVKLVGVDYVGLGSDFDGTSYTPKELEDVSKYPNITKGLRERGYSKREIKKILGGNLLRVFKANMS